VIDQAELLRTIGRYLEWLLPGQSKAIVAEGVETRAQADRLIAIGCPTGQGNGIAAAMPADQVADWVRDYDGMPKAAELYVPA
jgi:EAL domain-containing protein (putative c-di-GMP-specific phosphodiesterase class I)